MAQKKMTGHGLKECIRDRIKELGIQNIYRVTVKGFRDPDILFDLNDMDPYGNITDLTDETKTSWAEQGRPSGEIYREPDGL